MLATAPLSAQLYTELGDAGQTLGGAQTTGPVGGLTLTTIAGSISGINDADLYIFRITNTTTFSATTVNAVTTGSALDTALFLFNSLGAPIYTNDDASGVSVQSNLPAGTEVSMTLNPGIYILGISVTGNEPINLSGQLLFAGFPGGNSTAVRGPAGGINPNSLSNFNNQGSFAQSGAYNITLTASQTASAIPEPSVTALLVVAAAGLVVVAQRRVAQSRA